MRRFPRLVLMRKENSRYIMFCRRQIPVTCNEIFRITFPRILFHLSIIQNRGEDSCLPPDFGRGDGIRTHDLLVPNQARYHLRYASIQKACKCRPRHYLSAIRTLTGAGDGRAHFLMRRLRAEALVKFCCKQRTVLFALRKIPSQGSTPVPLDLCPLTDFDWSR